MSRQERRALIDLVGRVVELPRYPELDASDEIDDAILDVGGVHGLADNRIGQPGVERMGLYAGRPGTHSSTG